MNKLCSILVVLVMVGTLFAAAPRNFSSVPKPLYATDRIKIKLTGDAISRTNLPTALYSESSKFNLNELDQIFSRNGGTKIIKAHRQVLDTAWQARTGFDRWFVIILDGRSTVEEAIKSFKANRYVEDAIPEYIAYTTAVPNDTYYANNWGHNNTAQLPYYTGGSHSGAGVGTVGFDTNAQAAWDQQQGYGSSSIIIAIIDSGVDTAHADLRLVTGYDYGDNDSNPMDDAGGGTSSPKGHGTSCSGVAAGRANNSLGVTGIAGGCSVMPLKVADSSGYMYFSYIDNAITHAADNGADIISMSLGAAITPGQSPTTDAAIVYAYNAGVVLFGATGNYSSSAPTQDVVNYPANHLNVIGVAAASPTGERKSYTSSDGETWWGSIYGKTSVAQDAAGAVDITGPTILPATDISGSTGYSTTDYYMWFNGTSCATPYVAGVAALLLSLNPSLTPTQIRTAITSTAIDMTIDGGAGWDRFTGYGLVDANAALSSIASFPQITWNPGSFTQSLYPNNTNAQMLSIGNSGGQTLNYSVSLPTGTSTFLDESFENGGAIPTGWSQEYVSGSVSWAFATGGYNASNPSTAYDGTYNARLFFNNGSINYITKLVSPAMNLSGATTASLSFYHTQAFWSPDQDQLKVYYKTSAGGAWTQLAHYTTSVTSWTNRIIDLPNLSPTYYIAFEGITDYGWGVCVDKVVVTGSAVLQNNWLTINGGSSASGSIASGASNANLVIGFSSMGLTAATYNSTLNVTSNSNNNSSFSIPVSLTVMNPPAPAIVVSPGSLDFGSVLVGQSPIQSFTIQNTGTATLNGSITTPDGYSVQLGVKHGFSSDEVISVSSKDKNTLIYAVGAGNTQTFDLIFSPTDPITYNGSVTISHNAEGAVKSITVSGAGHNSLSVPFADGFETGISDWQLINGSQTNKWVRGTAANNTGDYGLYISNDSGANNAYDVNSTSVVHAYRDLMFPAGSDNYNLRIAWKGNGEGVAPPVDYLKIHLIDPSITPVAGFELLIGQISGHLNQMANWATLTIALPEGLSDIEKRLVFTWLNNASSGTQAPAAIDDIRIIAGNQTDAAVIIDDTVVITPPPVQDESLNYIHPSITISGLSDPAPFVSVTTGYNSLGSGYPNAGLDFTFTGADFSGATINFTHNLGFVPPQLAYRIGDLGDWSIVNNPGDWTSTTASFTVPSSKAEGDVFIIFADSEEGTLPITLSSFTATINSTNNVSLYWVTASETGILGFYVYRSEQETIATAAVASPLIPGTNTSTEQHYLFTDSETLPSTRYYYWLQGLDVDGYSAFMVPLLSAPTTTTKILFP